MSQTPTLSVRCWLCSSLNPGSNTQWTSNLLQSSAFTSLLCILEWGCITLLELTSSLLSPCLRLLRNWHDRPYHHTCLQYIIHVHVDWCSDSRGPGLCVILTFPNGFWVITSCMFLLSHIKQLSTSVSMRLLSQLRSKVSYFSRKLQLPGWYRVSRNKGMLTLSNKTKNDNGVHKPAVLPLLLTLARTFLCHSTPSSGISSNTHLAKTFQTLPI